MLSLLSVDTQCANESAICEYSALHTNTYANRPEITKENELQEDDATWGAYKGLLSLSY